MMNKDGVMTHLQLLDLLDNLEASKSTIFRIIEHLNTMKSQKDFVATEKKILSSLQTCKTEEEVIRKLDEAGL